MRFEDWEQQDLDAAPELPEEERRTFVIEDDLTADWAVREIRRTEDRFDKQIAIACQWIRHYEAQIEELKEKKERQTGFLRSCLEEYFRRQEHRTTKSGIEKYDLLSGRLAYRPMRMKIRKGSEDELIAWCEKSGRGECVRQVKELDWAKLKKGLTVAGGDAVDAETGEVVPGAVVEAVPAEFSVEVDRTGRDK